MPNWCSNGITISHTDPSTWKWFLSTRFDFEKISPQIKVTEDNFIEMINKYCDEIPWYSNTGICKNQCKSSKEFEGFCSKAREQLCDNLEFDLRSHILWGTKWKVDIDEEVFIKCENDSSQNELYLTFCSAWNPPNGIYKKLHEMGFKISANFIETGADFLGTFSNEDGELKEESSCYSAVRRQFLRYRRENKFKKDYNDYQFLKYGVEENLFNEGMADMLESEIDIWIEDAEEYEEEEVEETNE
tara:strand:- start:522 stop:1256 length:735 start_codon:yes stop_codon:yes gene_type:complete